MTVFDRMYRSGIGPYFNKIYKAKWPKIKHENLTSTLPSDCKYMLLEFIKVSDGAYSELMSGISAK